MFALLAGFLSACNPAPPDIFVVVLDTLRADHLGTLGYERETSPNLDAFAQESIIFTQNRSQASCTFPSIASLLTSRSPQHFLGQADQAMGIPQENPSLPTLLQNQGYWTLAVSASPIIRDQPSRFNPHGGYSRGFDVFDEACIWQSAECLLNRLTITTRDKPRLRPLFSYLHFMDPHGPYDPPEDFPRIYGQNWTGNPDVAQGDPNPIFQEVRDPLQPPTYSWEDIQHLKDLYDEEIRYLDQSLEDLFFLLNRDGPFKNAIVAIVADHGESFLEHPGAMKHCTTVWDTEVHTPLFLRIPGVEGRRIDLSTRNLDVLPTLMDYAGLPIPEESEGLSLRPLIEGRENQPRLAASMAGEYQAVSDGRLKLIFNEIEDSLRLFDLSQGIEVEINPEDHRKEFLRLRTYLSETMHESDDALAAVKNLESLGYL